MNILLVDGDEHERRRLAEVLAQPGREISIAADVESARALVERAVIVIASAASAAEMARLMPAALVVLAAWPHELLPAIAELGERAFDALQKPIDAESCARALARAHDHLRALEEVARVECELEAERVRLDEQTAALEREIAELPALEHRRAHKADEVTRKLESCLARVPARLDDSASHVDDAGAHAAIVDGAAAARQAMRMVADLLDVTRAERERLPSSPRRVALAPFLAEVLAGVERVANDYNTGVDLSIQGGGDASLLECETDPELLRRALQNLLETALRRSRRGRVRFEVDAAEGRVRFAVADSGGAVPARSLENLFDRLSRLEPGTIQRGAGLGFCRAVADALGGTLEAAVDGEVGLRLSLAVPREARSRL